MPYSHIRPVQVEGKTKYCFYNEETRERICGDTKKKAVAAMQLRYHLEGGGKLTKAKKK